MSLSTWTRASPSPDCGPPLMDISGGHFFPGGAVLFKQHERRCRLLMKLLAFASRFKAVIGWRHTSSVAASAVDASGADNAHQTLNFPGRRLWLMWLICSESLDVTPGAMSERTTVRSMPMLHNGCSAKVLSHSCEQICHFWLPFWLRDWERFDKSS